MQENQQGLVIDSYGSEPYIKTVPVPKPKEGELLIKVDASTINPSDLIFLAGHYFKRELPALCGLEGTGNVVSANGEALQGWVGKRVSFASMYGTWCEYSVTNANSAFEISEDVDRQSAASGVVNPLTVIGFIETFKQKGYKGGIIHTAAASNLGKMLNKLCQTQKIPLLGLVRRQQSADVMLKEGISDIVVTTGEWKNSLKEIAEKKGYDCLFDALGGGPVLDEVLQTISPKSGIYVYGVLEGKPFTISNPALFFQGISVSGFLLFPWWMSVTEEVRTKVRANYSNYLKKELQSTTGLTVTMKQIKDGLKFAATNPAGGKVLIDLKK